MMPARTIVAAAFVLAPLTGQTLAQTPSYCQGFDPDACARIASVVQTKVPPSYCKSGFALVGSGLSPEQLRICYVMTGNEMEKNKSPQEKAAEAAAQRQKDENRRRAALDAKVQDWRRVEADNGAIIAIDMNSIQRSGPDVAGRRTADAIVCAVENNACELTNQDRWIFYCTSNQVAMNNGMGESVYVPPLSVARRIMNIACEN
jgi:hypothetical protein